MAKSENGVAVKGKNTGIKFISVTELLHEWGITLNTALEHDEGISTLPEMQASNGFSVNHNYTSENIQQLIIGEMIGRSGARDKEEFIQMVQRMVTKLLDNLSLAAEKKLFTDNKETLLNLSQTLLSTIHFIQSFFGNYFDKNEKVPAFLINLYRNEITKAGNRVAEILEQSASISLSLTNLLNEHFIDGAWMAGTKTSYRHFFFEKELITELSNEANPTDTSIRNLLYYFNFNCSAFVMYEFDRLVEMITQLSSKSEKINLLRKELKTVNQLSVRKNYCFDENMPSLKEQVSTWIEEEIKYSEAGHFAQSSAMAADPENKIQTTLSVAKLSLLIRLLVVDKIIINRTVAPMLRTIAKTFTTLQREEVSVGSLETKYHAPDKATISVMKEMLQKWIVILGKL